MHYPRIRKCYPLTDEDIATYLARLREASILVPLTGQQKLIAPDPDDDKFIECAVTDAAKYVLSGDAYLLDLEGIPRDQDRESDRVSGAVGGAGRRRDCARLTD